MNKENWIDYLKFVACILITNSHCREIYPIQYFAIGGGFGNAIFFALQGYLLVNVADGFILWYRKRLSRLLPAIVAISCLNLLINYNGALNSLNLAWRTCGDILNKYWFCGALLIYYLVYYWIMHSINQNIECRLKVSFIVWLCIYVVYYVLKSRDNYFFVEQNGFSIFKVYYYFGIMLAGAYIRIKNNEIANYLTSKKHMRFAVLIGTCSVLAWIIEYAFIMIWNKLLLLQILIHIGVFGFTVMLICICVFKKNLFIYSAFVDLIASATLEIYLFQVSFDQIKNIGVFPIQLFSFWMAAIVGGILIHKLLMVIRKIIGGSKRKD